MKASAKLGLTARELVCNARRAAMRVFRAVLCAALCAPLLTSCAGGAVKLTYENGAYRNEKSGLAFVTAPICYRAVSRRSDEVIAKIAAKQGSDVLLYAIDGMDSSKWLTDDSFAVYYGEAAGLPTLRGMQCSRATLCMSGSYTYPLGTIEKQEEIDDLVEIYELGTTVPSSKIIPQPEKRYELLFLSELYPGLAYSLEYWKFNEEVYVYTPLDENGEIPDLYPGIRAEIVNGEARFQLGTSLVYDRSADRCYAIGNILESYLTAD